MILSQITKRNVSPGEYFLTYDYNVRQVVNLNVSLDLDLADLQNPQTEIEIHIGDYTNSVWKHKASCTFKGNPSLTLSKLPTINVLKLVDGTAQRKHTVAAKLIIKNRTVAIGATFNNSVTKVQNWEYASGSTVTSLSITYDTNPTQGNQLHFLSWSTGALTSVKTNIYDDVLNAYSLDSGFAHHIRHDFVECCIGGATTVTFTTVGVEDYKCAIGEYSGLRKSNSLDQTSTAYSASGSVNSGNITTTENNDFIIGFHYQVNGTPGTPDSGFTEELDTDRIYLQTQELTTTQTLNHSPAMTGTDTYIAGIASFKVAPGSSNWLSGWQRRKKITIDNAYVDSNLINNTVYIKISSDSDIGARALSTGYDIRFTTSDGLTLLNYERESFSITSGSASGKFWVKVPIIYTAADTDIYIYYGNSSATDGQDSDETWHSERKCVLHLPESGNGTNDEYLDSTRNNVDGQGGGGTAANVPTRVSGVIDYAQSFDGTNDFIQLPDDSPIKLTNDITVEAWVKTSTADKRIVEKIDTSQLNGYVLTCDSSGHVIFNVLDNSGSVKSATSTSTIHNGSWHHVQGTYNGTARIYVDGVMENNSTSGGGSFGNNGYPVYIGKRRNDTDYWNGQITEVRISNYIVTGDSAKFHYRNVTEADNEIAFSSEQSQLGYKSLLGFWIGYTGTRIYTEGSTSIEATGNINLYGGLYKQGVAATNVSTSVNVNASFLYNGTIGIISVGSLDLNASKIINSSFNINSYSQTQFDSSKILSGSVITDVSTAADINSSFLYNLNVGIINISNVNGNGSLLISSGLTNSLSSYTDLNGNLILGGVLGLTSLSNTNFNGGNYLSSNTEINSTATFNTSPSLILGGRLSLDAIALLFADSELLTGVTFIDAETLLQITSSLVLNGGLYLSGNLTSEQGCELNLNPSFIYNCSSGINVSASSNISNSVLLRGELSLLNVTEIIAESSKIINSSSSIESQALLVANANKILSGQLGLDNYITLGVNPRLISSSPVNFSIENNVYLNSSVLFSSGLNLPITSQIVPYGSILGNLNVRYSVEATLLADGTVISIVNNFNRTIRFLFKIVHLNGCDLIVPVTNEDVANIVIKNEETARIINKELFFTKYVTILNEAVSRI